MPDSSFVDSSADGKPTTLKGKKPPAPPKPLIFANPNGELRALVVSGRDVREYPVILWAVFREAADEGVWPLLPIEVVDGVRLVMHDRSSGHCWDGEGNWWPDKAACVADLASGLPL